MRLPPTSYSSQVAKSGKKMAVVSHVDGGWMGATMVSTLAYTYTKFKRKRKPAGYWRTRAPPRYKMTPTPKKPPAPVAKEELGPEEANLTADGQALPKEVPPNFAKLLEPILPKDFPWEEFVAAALKPRRPCVRVNLLKSSPEAVGTYATSNGWMLGDPVPWTNGHLGRGGIGHWAVPTRALEEEQEEVANVQLPAAWAVMRPGREAAAASSAGPATADKDLDDGEEEDPLKSKRIAWSKDATHFAGHVYVQDAVSLLPVAALIDGFEGGVAPVGAKVLDASAAPGGKTTALATWVSSSRGVVVANEPNPTRLKALEDNLLRTGALPWAAITQMDGKYCGQHWPEQFDAVLLDPPCSGESLTRCGEKPKDVWDKAEGYVSYLANIQRMMIVSCFRALKPGGVMVYSTCTLNPIENEDVLKHLEATFGDAVERIPLVNLPGVEGMMTPEGAVRCWPHINDMQGFFVARLRKARSTEDSLDAKPTISKRKTTKKDKIDKLEGALSLASKIMDSVSKGEVKVIEKFFKDSFGACPGLDLKGHELRRRGKEYWLVPEAIADLPAANLRRIGVRVAEVVERTSRFGGYKNAQGYQAHFEWAFTFGHLLKSEETPGIAHLSIQAARDFCNGEGVEPNWTPAVALAAEGGQAVARHGDFVLGLGRWGPDGQLKNDSPRHYRCENIVL